MCSIRKVICRRLLLNKVGQNVMRKKWEQHTVSWSEILKINSEIKKKLPSISKLHFGLIYSFRKGPNGLDLDV